MGAIPGVEAWGVEAFAAAYLVAAVAVGVAVRVVVGTAEIGEAAAAVEEKGKEKAVIVAA